MIRSKGASYIGATERPRVRSLRTKLTTVIAATAAAMTVFVGLGIGALGVDAASTKNVTAASAGLGISCSSVIGGNMDKRNSWGSGPLAVRLFEDLDGRTLTLSEIVGSPAWTNYTGIGDGPETDLFVTPYKDVIDSRGLNGTALDDGTGEGSSSGSPAGILPLKYSTNWAGIQEKLASERNTGTCFWEQFFVTNVANSAGLGLANALQMFVTWVSTTAFNSSFICDPENTAADGCIDLVKIIGGSDDAAYQAGGEGGIIGDLTNSIYKPLVLIVVIITALGVAWTGIVRRKFREALTQSAWLLFSFIIGLAILLNPSMLAKAPMIATNAITGCVIGSFNGVNCFDGTGFSAGTTSSDPITADSGVCKSEATAATSDEITALAVNSMGCTIWKTFILQNYAKGAFGVNLDQLETKNVETVAGKAVIAAGLDGNEFCYTLQTNGSISDYDGEWLQTKSGGAEICNLAVYSMLMQMEVTPAGETVGEAPSEYDPDWYDLIVTTASSEKMWPIWTTGGQQFAQGFVAVISVILGGFLIVVASIAALMYYITAIILLIFAPLFILVGIHPGRGKKIMLGWVETILSAILKYLASAVFLLVALALYSAVLGAADPMAALLFVAILSMVLWMYRKDLINMFSKVSLGGERMANVLEKQIPIIGASGKQIGEKASKLPGAIAGGAIGGLMAGGIGKVGAGVKIATQNELRSAPGLIGRAAQAKERQMRDNKADFSQDASRAKDTAKRAEAVAQAAEAESATADNEIVHAKDRADLANTAQENAEDDLIEVDKARLELHNKGEEAELELDIQELFAVSHQEALNNVADNGVANNSISPAFAEFRKLQMSIEALGVNAKLATIEGKPGLANELREQQKLEIVQRGKLEFDGTATAELRATWDTENQEFDRLLKHEQLQYDELKDEDGNIKQYNAADHIIAGQKVELAKEASVEFEAKARVTVSAAERADEEVVRAQSFIGEKEAAAADKQIAARQAKIHSAALGANADAMHDSSNDLGPGNLPTVRDKKRMEKEAFTASEKVRDSYSVNDKIAANEMVEAPGATVKDALDSAGREAWSIATKRKTIGQRTERLEGNRANNETRAADAEIAHQKASQAIPDQVVNARLSDRDAKASKIEYTEKLATANEASRSASEFEKQVNRERAQAKALEEAIASKKTVRVSPDEPKLSVEDSAKVLEANRIKVEARIAQTETAASDALARAVKAKAEADAAQLQMTVNKTLSDAANAKLDEAKRAEKEAKDGVKAAASVQKKETKETGKLDDISAKESNVLTASKVKLNSNPKTLIESNKNKSLIELISMAEKLSNTDVTKVDSMRRSQLANLQAQITNLAKDLDKNPGANQGLIADLSETIASMTKNKTQSRGIPTKPESRRTTQNEPIQGSYEQAKTNESSGSESGQDTLDNNGE